MKRSFFAAAIAVILLAAGCQKTEIMNQSGTSIGFATQTGKLTKAEDVAGVATLKSYGFRVWVYRNFTDEYYAGPNSTTNPTGLNEIYDAMEALPVTWNTTSSKWSTTKDYYWPGAGKELKFYAVSCNETDFPSLASAVKITNNDTETGTTTVENFVVLPTADNDLMVAAPITQAQGEGEGENKNSVKPVFGHTLTKVQFDFKTDAQTMTEHPVYIQNIKTSALKTTGTIALPFTATTEKTSPWTLEDATHQYEDNNATVINLPKAKDPETNQPTENEITIDGEVIPTDGTADRTGLTLTAGYQTLDTWLLLPQDISEATVTVTYIIKNRQFTKTFPLYADNLTKWDVNQFVKYNVTIAPNLISFEPSVEDWNETDVIVGDNGSEVYDSVRATSNQTAYTLFYKGELDVNTAVFVKDANGIYTAAADAAYLLEDGRTLTVANGKVTTITEPTPETPETPENSDPEQN